ncbi:hypothetical protein HanRHA438_Chr14g0639201 [Helianthus annuus]|nr:hypothetical protein HanRHA438_Chr14g0639201 [Helianthus annuus]
MRHKFTRFFMSHCLNIQVGHRIKIVPIPTDARFRLQPQGVLDWKLVCQAGKSNRQTTHEGHVGVSR